MLKDILAAKGIKQVYVAQKLGVSVVTVSNWAKGKTAPNEKNLKRLSELLQVPVKDIVH
ncbi:MAG: XRE family transcriptional regulator [Bacteroidia bacterium]|nr:helix-turn-helix transcriptional regulator [Bacteroidales bacterium]NCD41792.1 XRE family transcriptional regulator [Bacteroidia bacterium]MDD2323790.1 helix-turn-helix transcriptional regulator [Bacteroidales bacterium]MDD3011594.1 helix-turn-helix transcriptional regulator [Bacteroidales bacterium]MDD3962078.1 helix-turn-helix transcriptional regulator [Bacteroidales bacterium]